jgi:hypothetical protein
MAIDKTDKETPDKYFVINIPLLIPNIKALKSKWKRALNTIQALIS